MLWACHQIKVLCDPAECGIVSSPITRRATLLPAIKLRHADRISGEVVIPAQPGSYVDFPSNLGPRLADALRSRGIQKLYTHQRAAWDAITDRRHRVVVTPTASGQDSVGRVFLPNIAHADVLWQRTPEGRLSIERD